MEIDMPVHPRVQATLDQIKAQGLFAAGEDSVEKSRQNLREMTAPRGPVEPVAAVEDRVIPGPGGEIPVRIYTPAVEGPLPVYMEFHGGGFTSGDIQTSD